MRKELPQLIMGIIIIALVVHLLLTNISFFKSLVGYTVVSEKPVSEVVAKDAGAQTLIEPLRIAENYFEYNTTTQIYTISLKNQDNISGTVRVTFSCRDTKTILNDSRYLAPGESATISNIGDSIGCHYDYSGDPVIRTISTSTAPQ
jgi:hypothetical protein